MEFPPKVDTDEWRKPEAESHTSGIAEVGVVLSCLVTLDLVETDPPNSEHTKPGACQRRTERSIDTIERDFRTIKVVCHTRDPEFGISPFGEADIGLDGDNRENPNSPSKPEDSTLTLIILQYRNIETAKRAYAKTGSLSCYDGCQEYTNSNYGKHPLHKVASDLGIRVCSVLGIRHL